MARWQIPFLKFGPVAEKVPLFRSIKLKLLTFKCVPKLQIVKNFVDFFLKTVIFKILIEFLMFWLHLVRKVTGLQYFCKITTIRFSIFLTLSGRKSNVKFYFWMAKEKFELVSI